MVGLQKVLLLTLMTLLCNWQSIDGTQRSPAMYNFAVSSKLKKKWMPIIFLNKRVAKSVASDPHDFTM
jgi:hypothetical protein